MKLKSEKINLESINKNLSACVQACTHALRHRKRDNDESGHDHHHISIPDIA